METESKTGLWKHGLLHMLWGPAYSTRGSQQSQFFSFFLEKDRGYPTRCPMVGSIDSVLDTPIDSTLELHTESLL